MKNKKILKAGLSLVLMFTVVMFAGCFSSDLENDIVTSIETLTNEEFVSEFEEFTFLSTFETAIDENGYKINYQTEFNSNDILEKYLKSTNDEWTAYLEMSNDNSSYCGYVADTETYSILDLNTDIDANLANYWPNFVIYNIIDADTNTYVKTESKSNTKYTIMCNINFYDKSTTSTITMTVEDGLLVEFKTQLTIIDNLNITYSSIEVFEIDEVEMPKECNDFTLA